MSAASIGGAGLPRAASARRMAAPMSAVGASSAAVASMAPMQAGCRPKDQTFPGPDLLLLRGICTC